MKKRNLFKIFCIVSFLFSPNLLAKTQSKKYTLNEMVNEIVTSSPQIKESLFKYNSINEELNISKAGYLPKIDVIGKTGRVKVKDAKDYNSSELSLRLKQNIFNGFGTQHAINRDKARINAAFNKYVEVVQDKIYEAIEAYIKVLRYRESLKIVRDNIKVHKRTLQKIEQRYKRGFSTLSEVQRVKGRLALAKANFVVEKNNFYDAKAHLSNILGRNVDENLLVSPNFDLLLPANMEDAKDIAIHYNPSILVSNYDIVAVKEALQFVKKEFYPNIDLELKASAYDNKSFDTRNKKQVSAMLNLKYNLYNGGADMADKNKYISLLNYEYSHKNTLKRKILEALSLSWNANILLEEQLKHQVNYRNLTVKTKNAYSEEFQLGRRTLVDLLDVQDELNNIKIKVIHNKYDLLFAKYKIIDALGFLPQAFYIKLKQEYKKDTYPINLDFDEDKILDFEDHCDNSKSKDTKYYGCKEKVDIKLEEVKHNNTSGVKKLWQGK